MRLAGKTGYFLTPLGVGDILVDWGVSEAKVQSLFKPTASCHHDRIFQVTITRESDDRVWAELVLFSSMDAIKRTTPKIRV